MPEASVDVLGITVDARQSAYAKLMIHYRSWPNSKPSKACEACHLDAKVFGHLARQVKYIVNVNRRMGDPLNVNGPLDVHRVVFGAVAPAWFVACLLGLGGDNAWKRSGNRNSMLTWRFPRPLGALHLYPHSAKVVYYPSHGRDLGLQLRGVQDWLRYLVSLGQGPIGEVQAGELTRFLGDLTVQRSFHIAVRVPGAENLPYGTLIDLPQRKVRFLHDKSHRHGVEVVVDELPLNHDVRDMKGLLVELTGVLKQALNANTEKNKLPPKRLFS